MRDTEFRMMPWSDSDQLIYHIGQVTVSWNDVQFWFYAIFLKMLPDPRAEAIFFAIRTDRAQRDMVRELAEHVLTDHVELLDELKSKIAAADRLAGRRNDVLHAIWNLDPNLDKPQILLPKKNRLNGKNVLLEIKRLNEDLRKIEAALPDLTHRINSLLRKKGARDARVLVAQAFAKGLRPPDQAPNPKAEDRQSGRRGKRRRP